METNKLIDLVVDALANLKGQDIETLDVSDMTTITDAMEIGRASCRERV